MKNVFKRNQTGERGAVALTTTIIISILLGIIITGLISVMVSELRQEDDSEQATRAYFAAESGVEDAISQVLTAVKNGGPFTSTLGCNSNTNLIPGTNQVGYTCQQITYSGTPAGSLDQPDSAVQIDTGNASFRSMKLEWSTTNGKSGCVFNSTVAGNWTCAAPMELAIVQYPHGSFAAGTGNADLFLKNVVAVPNTVNQTPDLNSIRNNNPYTANCSPARTGFKCFININGFTTATDSYLFRLRSRFVGTDYKMTFYNGVNATGGVVSVPDGSATIDVTAKAGSSFRRVIYKVPYEHGAATGLDYVIYSDTNICKDFDVVNNKPENNTCP